MKTECSKPEKSQVKLTVTLDAAEANAAVKKVENAFMREAQIPGFRKGKVPLALIRKEFAKGLEQEIRGELVRRHYADAVKAAGIDEVALVDVQDVRHDADGGSFVAVVDVKPTFKLPTYKGLKVEFKDAKVDDAQVQDHLKRLREAYATYENAKDGEALVEGDYASIDYVGTVGGKGILEVCPEAKAVAEGKSFWVQVSEGHFLPELLEALKGMKAGEKKEGVKVTFDKEAAPDGLKGAKAEYAVTLNTFRRRILPDDKTFAEKAKAESVEKLAATIRESMEKRAVEEETARRENEAVELLMKKVDFDVPESRVARALDGYLHQLAQRAQYSGLDASYFEKNQEQILKDARAVAEKQVRIWYVVDAIAKAENLDVKDEEKGKKVIELILANAKK